LTGRRYREPIVTPTDGTIVPSLLDYLKVLGRRKLLFLLIVLLVPAAASRSRSIKPPRMGPLQRCFSICRKTVRRRTSIHNALRRPGRSSPECPPWWTRCSTPFRAPVSTGRTSWRPPRSRPLWAATYSRSRSITRTRALRCAMRPSQRTRSPRTSGNSTLRPLRTSSMKSTAAGGARGKR
jgi:hypothetical protein